MPPRMELGGAGTNLLLLAAGGGAAIMATPAEKFWWLAPIISGVAVVLAIWFNWGKDWHRTQRMRRPFYAVLIRPPALTEADMVNELTAPPDNEFSVQL